MKVLVDNNLDRRLIKLLQGHEVAHARDQGWAELANGEHLAQAELSGFDVMLTGDRKMRWQQNLNGRKLTLVVFDTLFIDFRSIAPLVEPLTRHLPEVLPGHVYLVSETGVRIAADMS